MRKALYTLDIDNYCPEIRAMTDPFLDHYAKKIGAERIIITERKFPNWPVTYEKLQIYDLARQGGYDWNIYIDADTVVHPELFDITEQIKKDTVIHNGSDMAGIRWSFDNYFRRDGRNIGSCNWFAIASDWCVDLWRPLDDLTLPQALSNIHPIPMELHMDITAPHLIDDYTLSRNIARYGLKFKTFIQLQKELGFDGARFLWHEYTLKKEDKIGAIAGCIKAWYMGSLNIPEAQAKSVLEQFDKLPLKDKVEIAMATIKHWKL